MTSGNWILCDPALNLRGWEMATGGFETFSLGSQGGHGFGLGGIQSEQLQVSYYELYSANLWF